MNQTASLALQADQFDLWGSRLIEASAGTGKTWTIAALYLRLILGHGNGHGFSRPLRPAEILVMTFTRAATRELSDRIRQRLIEAAQYFRGEITVDPKDTFLVSLRDDYPEGNVRNHAAWELAMAAENMDEASIHTIDAWCQRVLKEHAFDSGNLFDEELVADEEALRLQAVQDYWRNEVYPLAQAELQAVLSRWKSPDDLLKEVKALTDQPLPVAAGEGTLAEIIAGRKREIAPLKLGWAERVEKMQKWLDKHEWHGLKLKVASYTSWLTTLKTWANDLNDWEKPNLGNGWHRFTPEGLLDARKKGNLVTEAPPEFYEFDSFKHAIDQLPDIQAALLPHATLKVAARLLALKRQASCFGFSDMLHRLDTALKGQQGETLRQRILTQYPVIMIDEFQDTSPLQYQIFDHIYRTQDNVKDSALLLIGDPKQSIYGFRGADIYSYIKAKRATAGRHYSLQTNYRSTDKLVAAVNQCFLIAEKKHAAAAFMYQRGNDNPLPFEAVQANGRQEIFKTSAAEVASITLVHDLELRNADDARQLFGARCAEQIVAWLQDEQAGFYSEAQSFNRLRPADIAVLVRTGKEAAAVRRELSRRSIASVYLSDKDSVLNSAEASDLLYWLRAVAAPKEVSLIRAALATRTISLSLDELFKLANDEEIFDARCEQFSQLHRIWQTQGVLAMLRETLHQLALPARWLTDVEGERKLTNYLHLAELLQKASNELEGEQALIRWLQTEMNAEGASSDEHIVRLESDADLVKIITIHKSKGLEYPIVCIPYASSFRAVEKKSTSFVKLADEQGQRSLRFQPTDDEIERADQDRLKEDLRLFYVALTRARHSVWLGFSAVKGRNNTKCVSHKSAAGYLIGGTEQIELPADWLKPLADFAKQTGAILQAAAETPARTQFIRKTEQLALREAPKYDADFERDWQIGSFSKITKTLSASMTQSVSTPFQDLKGAEDEPNSMETNGVYSLPVATESPSWHQFQRGALAGNFLHEQLEWLAAENFDLAGNSTLAERLQRSCQRAGKAAEADLLVNWLTELVQVRLPGPEVALNQLSTFLVELEFWLPVQHLAASDIDQQCCAHLLNGRPRPALAETQLHGLLMGFADLVFEHQGKYWVLDYKSNHLGNKDADYDSAALAQSMAEHRYDVQAAIYLLALHRLLKSRLGDDYRPEQQLGGAVYLFLRGIHGPEKGVYLIPPSVDLLNSLEGIMRK